MIIIIKKEKWKNKKNYITRRRQKKHVFDAQIVFSIMETVGAVI